MSGLLTIGMARGLACKLLKSDEQGKHNSLPSEKILSVYYRVIIVYFILIKTRSSHSDIFMTGFFFIAAAFIAGTHVLGGIEYMISTFTITAIYNATLHFYHGTIFIVLLGMAAILFGLTV